MAERSEERWWSAELHRLTSRRVSHGHGNAAILRAWLRQGCSRVGRLPTASMALPEAPVHQSQPKPAGAARRPGYSWSAEPILHFRQRV